MSTVPPLRPAATIAPPAGDNPPLVAADARMETIRGLCAFEGRLTGTDAERRAAGWLAERLRGRGRSVEIEPTYVHPQYGLVHAVHCALGFAGSLLAIAEPVAGFALALFAATSMYLDLNGRFYLVRTLFFRRASQNLVSPGPRPEAPFRLIISAHYDAARTGAVFAPERASACRPARPATDDPDRSLPAPLLVARSAAPAAGRADGRRRLRPHLARPAAPHADPLDRRLRLGRHRALGGRSRRQRQRIGCRHRDLGRRRARP